MAGLNFAKSALDPATAERLRMAHVVGGDGMPWPSKVNEKPRCLTLSRSISDSGSVHIPWLIPGIGEIYVQTTSLMERDQPYLLIVELARGELDKFRNQLADWELLGLKTTATIRDHLREATHQLSRAVRAATTEEAEQYAAEALSRAVRGAEEMTLAYARQAMLVRQQRQRSLRKLLGCSLDPGLLKRKDPSPFLKTFNLAHIPLRWHRLEARQGECGWKAIDRQVDWALANGLEVMLGPILDFGPGGLPDWLYLWETEPSHLATFMIDLVETTIHRYRGRVRRWEICTRGNSHEPLSLNEEQMIWLAHRLTEAARDADPDGAFWLSVDQPWGEYLGREDRSYSPFSFADTLVRMGCPVAGILVDVAMGYQGGSFPHSLLDLSRILDQFHTLGLPIATRLAFPSEPVVPATTTDPAEGEAEAGVWIDPTDRDEAPLHDGKPAAGAASSQPTVGCWHDSFSPAIQAEWAESAMLVCLAKPYIEIASWAQFHDWVGGTWTHGGLANRSGRSKPAFLRLQRLRKRYLSESDPTEPGADNRETS